MNHTGNLPTEDIYCLSRVNKRLFAVCQEDSTWQAILQRVFAGPLDEYQYVQIEDSYTHTHTHTRTHACMHTCTHARTHAHTHTSRHHNMVEDSFLAHKFLYYAIMRCYSGLTGRVKKK